MANSAAISSGRLRAKPGVTAATQLPTPQIRHEQRTAHPVDQPLRQGRADHQPDRDREERDAERPVGQVRLRLGGGDARHPHPAGQPHDQEMRRHRESRRAPPPRAAIAGRTRATLGHGHARPAEAIDAKPELRADGRKALRTRMPTAEPPGERRRAAKRRDGWQEAAGSRPIRRRQRAGQIADRCAHRVRATIHDVPASCGKHQDWWPARRGSGCAGGEATHPFGVTDLLVVLRRASAGSQGGPCGFAVALAAAAVRVGLVGRPGCSVRRSLMCLVSQSRERRDRSAVGRRRSGARLRAYSGTRPARSRP